MANIKNRPDVLRDGAKIVGGVRVIETPATEFKGKPSAPGRDQATHSYLCGPGKKRFTIEPKSGK